MTAEKIAEELRDMISYDASFGLRVVLHAQITTLLDELDRLKVAEMERKLLLTPMAERIAELPDFMAALSEWGCEDPNEQADSITAFLNSTVGLREYLEDQSKAGGRDGH